MSTDNCIICGMPVFEEGCYRHDAEDINEFAARIIAEKTEELRDERTRANAHRDEVSRLRALLEESLEYMDELILYKNEGFCAIEALGEEKKGDLGLLNSQFAQLEKYLASVRAALGPMRDDE